eukprot:CAMPEP_0172919924 /NCGR_PEP_ID=MMETSP1075-20121228/203051_1 /TAXON_ID=2916 /ORGANISM="Ceratium fusus, Strain PA161109" /LENGTH=150 /DNA_ID=CAMNT_0013779851 /DNA_START=39 /DNA_END=488 /DNA_ORIENTATION=-
MDLLALRDEIENAVEVCCSGAAPMHVELAASLVAKAQGEISHAASVFCQKRSRLVKPFCKTALGQSSAAPFGGEPMWVRSHATETNDACTTQRSVAMRFTCPEDRRRNQDKDTYSLWNNKSAALLPGWCDAEKATLCGSQKLRGAAVGLN